MESGQREDEGALFFSLVRHRLTPRPFVPVRLYPFWKGSGLLAGAEQDRAVCGLAGMILCPALAICWRWGGNFAAENGGTPDHRDDLTQSL